ncbi:hypothetical protein H8356DRAFT_1362580 [Neocallimastix lanati (nom. inval.)]|nr:hypothetical protein H8356DRAFT_1362580 [Neocallimastix sp. JGI-2020a]
MDVLHALSCSEENRLPKKEYKYLDPDIDLIDLELRIKDIIYKSNFGNSTLTSCILPFARVKKKTDKNYIKVKKIRWRLNIFLYKKICPICHREMNRTHSKMKMISMHIKMNFENMNELPSTTTTTPTTTTISASIVTVGRDIETQKGENSIGLHYLTKKNIFIREVRTIYTFNGKTVLTCKNNFKEIFRNMFA